MLITKTKVNLKKNTGRTALVYGTGSCSNLLNQNGCHLLMATLSNTFILGIKSQHGFSRDNTVLSSQHGLKLPLSSAFNCTIK